MNRIILSIVIPCLNEVETVWKVVKEATKNGEVYFKNKFEVIVADNGSTDGTLQVLKKHNFKKIVNVPVKGYGAALHYGILASKGAYVIYADADQSYPFSNLSQFKKFTDKNYDLVLGSRISGTIQKNAMPLLHRYLGTPILTFLIRLFYGLPTTDCNSGMRLINKKFYKSLNMRNSGMEWASELLLKTAIKKGKYTEVPILFKKDGRNKAPHLSTWADGWRHLKAIVLLKPIIVIYISLILLIVSTFTYSLNFALTVLLIILAFVLALSYATLSLLKFAIEKERDFISNELTKFALVPTMLSILGVIVGFIFLLPDNHMGTKLLLCGVLGILSIWIFLIETIKTHMINRLPNI